MGFRKLLLPPLGIALRRHMAIFYNGSVLPKIIYLFPKQSLLYKKHVP